MVPKEWNCWNCQFREYNGTDYCNARNGNREGVHNGELCERLMDNTEKVEPCDMYSSININPKYKKFFRLGNEELHFLLDSYQDNQSLAVCLLDRDEEMYVVATVNIAGYSDSLAPNEAYLDTNNFPEGPELLEKFGFAHNTGEVAQSGFCTYPLYKFDFQLMDDYIEH